LISKADKRSPTSWKVAVLLKEVGLAAARPREGQLEVNNRRRCSKTIGDLQRLAGPIMGRACWRLPALSPAARLAPGGGQPRR